jgi:hypothetical protein
MGDYSDCILFSPDGSYLAVPLKRKPGFVQLWNLDTFSTLDPVGAQGNPIYSLAFSPDGTPLATGDSGGQVSIWETLTWKRIQTLWGHQSVVRCMEFAARGDKLFTGGSDTTVLSWDLSLAPSGDSLARKSFTSEEWEQLWQNVANMDPAKAHAAIRILVAHGESTVNFLKSKLSPMTDRDIQAIRHLINQLDDTEFSVRQSATSRLIQLGIEATPLLRHTLTLSPSLETQNRIKEILQSAQSIRSPQTLRRIRSIQILERIDRSESRLLLQRLANGSPSSIQTIYAKAALAGITQQASCR